MEQREWQSMANIVFIETGKTIEIGEREGEYWPKIYETVHKMYNELVEQRAALLNSSHEHLLEKN